MFTHGGWPQRLIWNDGQQVTWWRPCIKTMSSSSAALVSAGFSSRAPLEETKVAFIPHEPTTIPHSVPSMATLLHAAPSEGECLLPARTAYNSRVPIISKALPNVFECDNSCGKAVGNQPPYQCCTVCHITKFLEDNTRNVTSRHPGRLPLQQPCCVPYCLLERNSLFTSKADKKRWTERLSVRVWPVAQEQAAQNRMHWWNNRSTDQVTVHHPVRYTRKSTLNPPRLYWLVCSIKCSTECSLFKWNDQYINRFRTKNYSSQEQQ